MDAEGDLETSPGLPVGVRARATGTHDRPGIQPADVAELVDHGADVVVLSRGRELRLETSDATLAWPAARQVEVVRDETGAAVGPYNRPAMAGRL